MRILFVSSSSGSIGGGEIFLVYLAMALHSEGHELALWASSHPRMDKISSAFAPYGDVLRSDYRNTYDHWHRGLLSSALCPNDRNRILGEWRRWKPDVIHFNKQCLEDGLDLLEAASFLKAPHLVTIHITQSASYLGSMLSRLRDWCARRALRKYNGAFVAVVESRADDLRSFIKKFGQQIFTVRNGIPKAPPCPDRTAVRRKENIPDALAVVAIGRMTPQKRPLRFIQEIKRIREAGIPVYGRWIGDGSETQRWDHAVKCSGMQGYLTRDDWRDDVALVLPAFDLFLHTAAFEGLPFALLEAMQAGLPCVVAEGVAQQLPPTLRACVLPLGENLDWAAVLANHPALASLAKRGQKMVAAEYSLSNMGAAYARLYLRLCRHRQPPWRDSPCALPS